MESINEAINEYSINLLKELSSSNSEKNVFCSPLSTSVCISLLLLGAKENTASQMEKLLNYSELKNAKSKLTGLRTATDYSQHHEQRPQKQQASLCNQVAPVHSELQSLLSKLMSQSSGTQLNIANGVYTQKMFPFLFEYLVCAKQLYDAELESVDFKKDETRKKINSWVENQTQGKITDLFPENSIEPDTSLILVNAIYFKGKWSKQFKEEDTNEAPFYVTEKNFKPVQMMTQKEDFKIGIIENLNAKVIELPYGKGDMSLFILLPDEISGLKKVEQQLSSKSLASWTSSENMMKTKVELHLPRFKLEESYDLGTNLQNMGMVDAFSRQKANLSGISEVGLYVSKVVHKAFLEINEEGTEAAAATGITIVPKKLTIPEIFKVNHPFLFFILHNESKTIIFMGKYISP
ncbi:ovalbumin-related protein X-like [Bombina bombina]|uniref:ovalbumin-related protein X-like n=1 Tax=Bombina bombina TaxID=8345 RepID=UPI00235AC0B1|nr:ovalbumin-related protein X-like [Bombina bombina]